MQSENAFKSQIISKRQTTVASCPTQTAAPGTAHHLDAYGMLVVEMLSLPLLRESVGTGALGFQSS